jgi:hypothetical protein
MIEGARTMTTTTVDGRSERAHVRVATDGPAARPNGHDVSSTQRHAPASSPQSEPSAGKGAASKPADREERREHFIPVTRQAIFERMTRDTIWPMGRAGEVRRFFRYLDLWRRQSYAKRVLELEKLYEPFNPDSDLLTTRTFSAADLDVLQRGVVEEVSRLPENANYTRVDPSDIALFFDKETHYGLDLQVDLNVFDELLIFYRGRSSRNDRRRDRRKLFLAHEEFDVPIYRRLFILFKIKTLEARIPEVMAEKGCNRKEAERILRKRRSALPVEIRQDCIYMKLFKNIPRTDIEMAFPNTEIRFRLFDKIKLGVTAGGGLGMGVIGTASKIAVATNPIALAGAVAGLGGVAIRQASNFMNQRNRYMVTMAQNLYFHSLGDNRAAMAVLAERGAEEDIKEEMLLYAMLARERVHESEIDEIDIAIEQWLLNTFGVDVDFELGDALERLVEDGIVRQTRDGYFECLPPAQAAEQIDAKWDRLLDDLPNMETALGREHETDSGHVDGVRPAGAGRAEKG